MYCSSNTFLSFVLSHIFTGNIPTDRLALSSIAFDQERKLVYCTQHVLLWSVYTVHCIRNLTSKGQLTASVFSCGVYETLTAVSRIVYFTNTMHVCRLSEISYILLFVPYHNQMEHVICVISLKCELRDSLIKQSTCLKGLPIYQVKGVWPLSV